VALPTAERECHFNVDHPPLLDRRLIREFLEALAGAELVGLSSGRAYDEQYAWLRAQTDPASELEREFLEHLYQRRLRLPDAAQYRPAPDIPVQPDFYYERGGIPGVCVFIDGPTHGGSAQAEHDCQVRSQLTDRGYRVVAITCHESLAPQIDRFPDVFGAPADRQDQ